MTARPTRRAVSRSGLARSAWWTRSSAMHALRPQRGNKRCSPVCQRRSAFNRGCGHGFRTDCRRAARGRICRSARRRRELQHCHQQRAFFHRLERLPDTLQRLDFIIFDLVPTLSLPFYLVYIVLLFGTADAALFLAAVYVVLLGISIFNLALSFAMFNRTIGFFALGASLIFPLYQGVYLKCARFFSYSSEIMFAASRYDDFVPPRVRRALLGTRI